MAGRSLSPDEAALWSRVMASVKPLRHVAPTGLAANQPPIVTKASPHPVAAPSRPVPPAKRSVPGVTLDGGWDRRLSRGAVAPDVTIDLHGHTLTSAYAVLDAGIEQAVRHGERVILLVTGKPPRPESERPHARGAIRAAVADWLAGSRHAGHIAAVRGAHPRHGGLGALYIILRRTRG